MPDLEKAIQWLEIERECVSRDCDRDCGQCDLAQDRETLLSACDDALALLKTVGKQINSPTYIVTEGCYSDYHIEGVFLNRESAKKYAALCGGQVETFIPLDRQDGHQNDEKVRITYRHSTNEIINIYFSSWNDSYDKDSCCGNEFKFTLKVNSRVGQDVILNGADSELALKVAQDRYAAWKYENELIQVGGIISTQKNLDAFAKGGE